MTRLIVRHEHDCACKGCKRARREEMFDMTLRTPPWPAPRRKKPAGPTDKEKQDEHDD